MRRLLLIAATVLLVIAATVLLATLGTATGSSAAPTRGRGTASTAAGGTSPIPLEASAPGDAQNGSHELGDVDCANGLSAIDALFVLRYTAGLSSYGDCVGIGDVSCNGFVDAVDALGVLRAVAALPPIPAPPWCYTMSQAISIETSDQAGAGWDLVCPEWRHQLADVVGSFDNVNHHRAAVYCKGTTPADFAEKLVIYELQSDQLIPLLTRDDPIGDFPAHFDLASWGENPFAGVQGFAQ